MLGNEGFILTSRWPIADPALMKEDVVTIVVQVNGKLRGQVEVPNPARGAGLRRRRREREGAAVDRRQRTDETGLRAG